MEILEVLFALPEVCACSVDVLALFIDISAGPSIYRTAKKKKAGQAVRVWPAVVLILVGVALTTLVVLRWVLPRR